MIDERFVIASIKQKNRELSIVDTNQISYQHSANLYLKLDIDNANTNPFSGMLLSAVARIGNTDRVESCPIATEEGKQYILLTDKVLENSGVIYLSIGGVNEKKVVITSNTVCLEIVESNSIIASVTPVEEYWQIEVKNAIEHWYNTIIKPDLEAKQQQMGLLLEETAKIQTETEQLQKDTRDTINNANSSVAIMQENINTVIGVVESKLANGEFVPAHKWEGAILYFKNPDGTWDSGFNISTLALEDGSVTENKLDQLLQQKVNGYVNINLLTNADFRNPVNQRGQDNYDTNTGNAYTLDRWRANGLIVTVNSNSITLTNNNSSPKPFIQPRENSLHTGYYTATINVLNISGYVSIRYYDVETNMYDEQENLFIGKNTKTINNSVSVFGLLLGANSTVEIEYIKLEPGQFATPFVSKPYAEELQRCERFYNYKSTVAFGIVSGSSFFGFMPMSTQMIDNVTASIKNTVFNINCDGVTYNPTITSVITAVPKYGGVWIGFRFTGATIPNKTVAMIEGLQIEFDAEIY